MRLTVPILFAACLAALQGVSQSPITDVFTEYVKTNESVSYTNSTSKYYFGAATGSTKNNQLVIGFSIPSGSFFYNMYAGGSVKIRRVNNSVVAGGRSLLWMESVESGSTYKIFPSYNDSMEQFFDGRIINKGTDNLFGNRGDGSGNNNNIERVDWIAAGGMKTANVSQSGFAVFERGVDDKHDPFCVAAITSLDVNGDPKTYGKIVRVSSEQYGSIPNSTVKYTIMRKEQSEQRLLKSANGTQNRGGVLITFEDLGVKPNQSIYGYSLFATDLPADAKPADLIDYSNPKYFPRNTSSDTQEGGIDLIAITGLFNTSTSTVFLPVNIQEFRGAFRESKAELKWKITSAGNCQGIDLQRSEDGTSWKAIARLQGTAESYTDLNAGCDRVYYRLQVQETSGRTSLSPVICLVKPLNAGSFQVLRSAIAGSQLHLTVQSPGQGQCQLRWYSAQGQLLSQQGITIGRGTNELALAAPVFKGTAIVQLSSGASQFSTRVVMSP